MAWIGTISDTGLDGRDNSCQSNFQKNKGSNVSLTHLFKLTFMCRQYLIPHNIHNMAVLIKDLMISIYRILIKKEDYLEN